MNYTKIYNQLINKRKLIIPIEYTEKHHIIPKSMGGLNNQDNIVKLTAREHYIAHWLLYRIHKNAQMTYAFFALCGLRSKYRNPVKISSYAYEIAKKALSKETSKRLIEFNHMKGVKMSQSSRDKMSNNHWSKKGIKPWNNNIPMSQEMKDNISAAKKGKCLKTDDEKRQTKLEALKRRRLTDTQLENSLKKRSEQSKGNKNNMFGMGHKLKGDKNGMFNQEHSKSTKNKISVALKKQIKIKCPHCEIVGIKPNMKRWHFDNCKVIKNAS